MIKKIDQGGAERSKKPTARAVLRRTIGGQAGMTDTNSPKRRGRPPKAPAPPVATARLRLRAGVLEQAWQHPTGTAWRAVPVVPDTAPDWEDE